MFISDSELRKINYELTYYRDRFSSLNNEIHELRGKISGLSYKSVVGVYDMSTSTNISGPQIYELPVNEAIYKIIEYLGLEFSRSPESFELKNKDIDDE